MAVDDFLKRMDKYSNYCNRKRPSMAFVNPLPRRTDQSSRKRNDMLTHTEGHFPNNTNVNFIYPERTNNWIQKVPKVTVSCVQSQMEPVEFQTEFGEPLKRNLPSYYYGASQPITNKSVLQRRSQSARMLSKRTASARSLTPHVLSRRAFACTLNDEPIYFPDIAANSAKSVLLVDKLESEEEQFRYKSASR